MTFEFYSIMNKYECIQNNTDEKSSVNVQLYYLSQTQFKVIYLDTNVKIRIWDIMMEQSQEIDISSTFHEMNYETVFYLYPENIEYSSIPYYIHEIPFQSLIQNQYEIKNIPSDVSVFLYYVNPFQCKIYARSLYYGWNDIVTLVLHDCSIPNIQQIIVLSENHFTTHSKYWIIDTDVELKPIDSKHNHQDGFEIPSILVESEQPNKKTREKYYNRMCSLHSHPQFTYMCFTPQHQRRFIRTYFSQSIVDIYDLTIENKNKLFHICFLYIMGGHSIDFDLKSHASNSSLYKSIQEWNSEKYADKIDMNEYCIIILENPFREVFSFYLDTSQSILHIRRCNGWFVDLQIILIYQDSEYPLSIGNCIFMNEKKINLNLFSYDL